MKYDKIFVIIFKCDYSSFIGLRESVGFTRSSYCLKPNTLWSHCVYDFDCYLRFSAGQCCCENNYKAMLSVRNDETGCKHNQCFVVNTQQNINLTLIESSCRNIYKTRTGLVNCIQNRPPQIFLIAQGRIHLRPSEYLPCILNSLKADLLPFLFIV